MKTLTRLAAVLTVLLAFTGIAAAAGPIPGPFSTTGYTTNLVLSGQWPGLPPLVPSEFEFLANGAIKFHINTQGGAEDSANDDYCASLVEGLFPPPVPEISTCAELCMAVTGKPCGTDGFFPDGSFTFDEWGLIVDPYTYTGYNHGYMSMATDAGEASLRFGGGASYGGVTGGYAFFEGDGDYDKLKGQGAYTGGAGYVFTVDYEPCGGKDQQPCPADRCAVFGEDLTIKKDKIEWVISNAGDQDLTVSKVALVWPEANGPATKVKLGGKTIYAGSLGLPAVMPGASGLWAAIDLVGWEGAEKDIQIAKGKKGEKLEVEFKSEKGLDISPDPWDYTILVEFKGGCGVPFVEFEHYFDPSQPNPAGAVLDQ